MEPSMTQHTHNAPRTKRDATLPDLLGFEVISVDKDELVAAFDIKPGDSMYLPPEKRVKVW